MHLQEKVHYLTLTYGVNVIWIAAQYLLHHVTYAPTKFEVATSNSLGEDAFTRKYIFVVKVKTKHYIMWPMYLQSLKLLRPTGYEMRLQENIWPWHETSPSTLYIIWAMHLQSLKLFWPAV